MNDELRIHNMNDELEKPVWGVWVDYKIAPPGSYACLVSRFMDNRWTDPEPQWMPAQLRPQLHGEVRVMPYLMPNDPLAAVNALPELLARVKRVEELEAENTKLKAALEPDMFWDQDNPEQPYYDVEELLREQDYDRDRDIILDTQEAIRCADGAYFCRINSPSEDSETDDEEVIIRKLTDDERKQWRAVYRAWLSMQYLKPLFARTALKEKPQ